MKTVPAPDRTPLRGVAVKLAIKHSLLHSIPQQSPLTSLRPHGRRDLRSSDSCSLELPSTARLFPRTAYSRLALLQRGSESTPKNASAHHPASPARIASPQTQKWAGTEMTLRIAWIKTPILPGFCLDDPPAVGSIRQVTLLEDAAVMRGVWSRSP